MQRTILKNGHVIDPAQGVDRIADVMIEGGKIAAVGRVGDAQGSEIVDVSGCYVTPGWIAIQVNA